MPVAASFFCGLSMKLITPIVNAITIPSHNIFLTNSKLYSEALNSFVVSHSGKIKPSTPSSEAIPKIAER